ncbi:MAG: phosphonate ABC transporter, permease protein PhnE [Pseudobdellovibrio sp.]
MSYKFKQLLFDGLSFVFVAMTAYMWILNPTPEEQIEKMFFYFQMFLGLYVVGIGISYYLSHLGFVTLGSKLFEPAYKKKDHKVVRWYKTFSGWQFLIVLTVLFIVGLIKTKFSVYELLNIDGFQGVIRLFNEITSPNLALLPKAILNIFETIFMAFMATVLAIPFAFVLSFVSAKNVMTGKVGYPIYLLTRTTFNIMRSIEAVLWAIIFSVWVGIGPFAGMLALMIHSIASLAKQYSEMVESVSDGPIEGVMSCGANRLQTVWYGIVPQVILPYVSFTVYRWDINVRMATIVGFVGGGGIGTLLIQYQGQAMWPEVGTIIMVIAIVVWLMDQASAYIREALK